MLTRLGSHGPRPFWVARGRRDETSTAPALDGLAMMHGLSDQLVVRAASRRAQGGAASLR